jgi:hypothetical protein
MRDPLLAAAFVACFVVAPAQAQGPGKPNKTSAAHYNRGVELYGEGDKKAALEEFKRAYEMQPNFRSLLNIAQIQVQVEDWTGAYTSFQRYLADGGSKVTPERHAQVEEEIKKLMSHIAVLTITTNYNDVEVTLDGKFVGKTPLDKPLVIAGGPHTLVGKKEGRPDVERKADLYGTVTVALDPGAAPAPVPAPVPVPVPETIPAPSRPEAAPKPEEPPQAQSSGGPTWIGWVATGAFAAGAVTSGVLAARASSRYDDKLTTFGVSKSDLDTAQSKARTLVIVTGALAGAAAVSAGVTMYLQLSRKPSREPPKDARFELLLGPGGIGARGLF